MESDFFELNRAKYEPTASDPSTTGLQKKPERSQ
jgi:hypothetical protein